MATSEGNSADLDRVFEGWIAHATACTTRIVGARVFDGIFDRHEILGMVTLRLARYAKRLLELSLSAQRAYIAKTVKGVVSDLARKSRGRAGTVLLGSLDSEPGEDDAAINALELQELKAAVRDLVGQLPRQLERVMLAWLDSPEASLEQCLARLQADDPEGNWNEAKYRTYSYRARATLRERVTTGQISAGQYLQILAVLFGAGLFATGQTALADTASNATPPYEAGTEPQDPSSDAGRPRLGVSAPEAGDPQADEAPDDTVPEADGTTSLGVAVSSFAAFLATVAIVRALWPLPLSNTASAGDRNLRRARPRQGDLFGAFCGSLVLTAYLLVHICFGPRGAALCLVPFVAAGLSLYAWRFGKRSYCVVLLVVGLSLIPTACDSLLGILHGLRIEIHGESMAGEVGRIMAWMDLLALVALVVIGLGILLLLLRYGHGICRAWKERQYATAFRLTAWCLAAAPFAFIAELHGKPQPGRRARRAASLLAAALAMSSFFALQPAPLAFLWWIEVACLTGSVGLAVLFLCYLCEASASLKAVEKFLKDIPEVPDALAADLASRLRQPMLDRILDAIGLHWFVGDEAGPEENTPPRQAQG